MTGVEPTLITVPVRGGDLAVNRWGPARAGAEAVLAAHGITGNGVSWGAVAQRLPDHDLIAPDLRGRGLSREADGPYGLARHADDLVAVLDWLRIEEPVVLAGHSMGAFVACVAAVRHPSRFSRLVLVDGGVGFPAPEGTDIDATLDAVVGPAVRRLAMEFESVSAYRDFFRQHPAFVGLWNDVVRAFVDRDLVGEPPHLRSACVAEAIRTDGGQVLRDEDVLAAAHKLPVPAVLLWAQRGMLNQPQGLYTAERLAAAGLPADVRTRLVPDTNHYSILFGDHGSDAVAEAIRQHHT
ncbi:MAG: alpha/beta fold hydrolase [Kutzneria sp.]|nr:alpha/beta fold hydrolase [Kutzneria sp.]MBV9844799.1 alpha/beta fold hydrolase [Kutzneria sp.]